MDKNQILLFLKEIELINSKYQKIVEVTHADFNIFSILRDESDEVKLHSAFIGELLNPKGSHRMGSQYLELFINVIKKDLNLQIDFTYENASCEIEKDIGIIPKDYTQGGRIDIYISEGKTKLAIENKIYAKDQEKQLKRYHNHIKSKSDIKSEFLLYLTLDEKSPDKLSIDDLEEKTHFFNITYKKHILEWLKLCKEKTVDVPVIRETIGQYINLIKRLTGKSLIEENRMELTKFLMKDSNKLKLARDIIEAFEEAKMKIQNLFWDSLAEALKKLKYEIIEDYVVGSKYPGIDIFFDEKKRISFRVEIEKKIFFGFKIRDSNEEVKNKIIYILSELKKYDFKKERNWLGWAYSNIDEINALEFKTFNSESIFELVNEVKRNKIAEKLANEINDIILGFISASKHNIILSQNDNIFGDIS